MWGVAQARHQLLRLCEQFRARALLGKREGAEQFCEKYSSGALQVDAQLKSEIPTVSPATLYRWQARFDEAGADGLADNYGNRAGTGIISQSEELQEWLLKALYHHPTVEPIRVHEGLVADRPDLAELCSRRTITRWLADWKIKHKSIWQWHRNPDKWKSHMKVAFGDAAAGIARLNQLWEMDSTPADMQLVDGRHTVIGLIDVWSRRLLLLVSPTSKAAAICALLRRGILLWGMPDAVRTDNGKDYVSVRFDGVCRKLEIDHRLCAPFASEQKPFVERVFKTLSHGLFELLPGYSGHNVAEAQELRARASFAERLQQKNEVIQAELTANQLQERCDRWVRNTYERRPHQGLRGVSPFDQARSWTGGIRRLKPEHEKDRTLDLLLEISHYRTVTKKGVALFGGDYIHADLGPLVGERVEALLDPTDLGRSVILHDKQFVCVAEDPVRTGISQQDVAVQARKRQNEARAEGMAAWREAARSGGADDIAAAIDARDEREAAKVSALPPRGVEEHTTENLDALSDAAKALDAPATDVATEPVRPVTVTPIRPVEVDEGDRLWAQYMRLRAGMPTADEAAWMRQFESTPLYRSPARQLAAGFTARPRILAAL
jgi:transposase InsO family protein